MPRNQSKNGLRRFERDDDENEDDLMSDEDSDDSSSSEDDGDVNDGNKGEDEKPKGEDELVALEETDPERDLIKQEISALSMEELLALKEKLGKEIYSEMIFGKKGEGERKPRVEKVFKRGDKNRPREESSKKPPPSIVEIFPTKNKEAVRRDPRFEESCGKYDEKIFKQRYAFIDEIKEKERQELQEELENEKDPERREQILYLIQRIDNQRAAERAKLEKEHLVKKLKEEKKEKIKTNGPIHINKSEIKKAELVEKFNHLKKSSKLDKYLEKKRKRNVARERKRVNL